ncbi:MAG: hypothetical protein V1847_04840 [Candidatus Diapherotrites archaeon]
MKAIFAAIAALTALALVLGCVGTTPFQPSVDFELSHATFEQAKKVLHVSESGFATLTYYNGSNEVEQRFEKQLSEEQTAQIKDLYYKQKFMELQESYVSGQQLVGAYAASITFSAGNVSKTVTINPYPQSEIPENLQMITVFLEALVQELEQSPVLTEWMQLEPVQCRGNPWQQWYDRLEIALPPGEQETTFDEQALKLYYEREHDISILNIQKLYQEGIGRCEACSCGEGYYYQAKVSRTDAQKLRALNWTPVNSIVELNFALLESLPEQLSISVQNKQNESIFLEGCNQYVPEKWIPEAKSPTNCGTWGEPECVSPAPAHWQTIAPIACVVEGNAVKISSGETKNLRTYTFEEDATYRVKVHFGSDCTEGKPFSDANCKSTFTLYGEPFQVGASSENELQPIQTEAQAIQAVKAEFPEVVDIQKCTADIGCDQNIVVKKIQLEVVGQKGCDENHLDLCEGFSQFISWNITFWKGWGDCPAGCISKHYWEFTVSQEGNVSKTSEYGDVLPGNGVLQGFVNNTTCPGACQADKNYSTPVANWEMMAIPADSPTTPYTFQTDANGHFSVELPAENYTLKTGPETAGETCAPKVSNPKIITIVASQTIDQNISIYNPCIV